MNSNNERHNFNVRFDFKNIHRIDLNGNNSQTKTKCYFCELKDRDNRRNAKKKVHNIIKSNATAQVLQITSQYNPFNETQV